MTALALQGQRGWVLLTVRPPRGCAGPWLVWVPRSGRHLRLIWRGDEDGKGDRGTVAGGLWSLWRGRPGSSADGSGSAGLSRRGPRVLCGPGGGTGSSYQLKRRKSQLIGRHPKRETSGLWEARRKRVWGARGSGRNAGRDSSPKDGHWGTVPGGLAWPSCSCAFRTHGGPFLAPQRLSSFFVSNSTVLPAL